MPQKLPLEVLSLHFDQSATNNIMKLITTHADQLVINLERGEELLETLLSYCKAKDITGATFTGLGATDMLELAFYNLTTKSYERHNIVEELEILSLTGNLGTLKEEKMLHIHGVFGRRDLSTLGGHIFKLRVSGACEIHLSTLPRQLHRVHDETTGLNLLCEI